MRIGFFVNDIKTEEAKYTTTRLAMAAVNLGHEAWIMDSESFVYDTDEKVHAIARSANKKSYKSLPNFLKELQDNKKAKIERISVDDLDILMLRSDPSQEKGDRSWAQTVGINFGRVAMRHGVIVLNDPNGLLKATNKMYFQLFPEEVRPKTIITRSRTEIRKFAKEHNNNVVLKPLQGSGGESVFLIKPDDMSNLNQIVDAVGRHGYIIAQEYLPKAAEGDIRLFMMNGQPLKYKGKYAAYKRVRRGEDIRSNLHAGGDIRPAEVTDEVLRVVEIVRPKLVLDGMFLVGLDIVGDKLMEINVFTPGGLGSARKFEKVNFAHAVIHALESKVRYMQYYDRNFDNIEMATL
ncbi:MAG: glutathione synthase [Acidobacteria bacterium]|nr:glutathione synthase [Acidobacteriota bacterium]